METNTVNHVLVVRWYIDGNEPKDYRFETVIFKLP